MNILKTAGVALAAATLLSCGNGETVKLRNGRVEDIASVQRNEEGYTVEVHKEGTWNIFQGDSKETIDWSDVSTVNDREKLVIPRPYPEDRLFFALVSANDSDTLYLSETHIPMEGTPNFRDLGGIITKDKRQVRWGQFFRSGSLDELTDNDLSYFEDLGIHSVIDLRSDKEIASAPDRLPDSLVHWQQVQIMNPSDMKDFSLDTQLTPELASKLLVESNKNFVLNIKRFQPIFDAMLGGEPFLFHCTAGKDRTGMSAALILMTLNVDREAIMNDYLLTNQYTIPYYEKNKDKMAKLGFSNEVVKELGGVKKEYLQAAFNAIDSIYGNSEAMLAKEFGITAEKQQELIKKYTY